MFMTYKEPGGRLTSGDWKRIHKNSSELYADSSITQGDFDGAFELLKRARKEHGQNRSGQLNMKLVALPFYEIEYRLSHNIELDVGLIDDAESIHGTAGELLAEYLHNFSMKNYGSSSYAKVIGDISELTVLALGARHFNKTGKSFLVPATYSQEYAKRYASDLRLRELDATEQTYEVQVKTKVHPRDYERYGAFISILPISSIDPRFCQQPDKRGSVARHIISELNGTYTDSTENALDIATQDMLTTIYEGQPRRMMKPYSVL